MNTTLIGVDLAKRSFSVCEVNATGRVLRRRDLNRSDFACYLAQLPKGTPVAMEACASSNHWGRRCHELGLTPLVMAAQFVSPFRKSQSAKNDRNDAEAIATAARQGNMRFVPVKDTDQQARLSWHRVRDGHKQAKTAIGNRIRGLLAEFGIVMAKGDKPLQRVLADLDAFDLPADFKALIQQEGRYWQEENTAIDACSAHITARVRQDERCQRLVAICGVGDITADAMVASVGKARSFKNGRQLAAWIGLVPKQFTTGGHVKLGRISRAGNTYLRTLLVQGARSTHRIALSTPPDKATPEQRWIQQLDQRMSFGKAVVVIANKQPRQIWAMMAYRVDYDPCATVTRMPQSKEVAA